MKKQAWFILCLIALVAGFALAATNLVTAGPIEDQRIKATQAARTAVFPDASSFEEVQMDPGSGLDSIYAAKSDTDTLGYVLQITVAGYGGPIEIILGIDTQGVITGLTVGGSNFAETAGLGTQVKEPAFTGQFVGLAEMPAINGNVDTISGATISSTAVINGIIRCYTQWEALLNKTETAAQAAAPLYRNGVYEGEAQGYGGMIKVSVTIQGGVIASIDVLEGDDGAQRFVQVVDTIISGVIAANAANSVDAVSDATISSQHLLDAIADALAKAVAV